MPGEKVELASAYISLIPSLKGANDAIRRELNPATVNPVGRAIGLGLVAGIGAAVIGLGAVIKTGLGEVMDAEAGQAQLAAGIKSTGNAAGVTLTGMNDLASSIQSYSGQTDDSITKTQGLLLTFTNIKNSGPDKIFDQATVAAADMAAKFGGDASSQAILLGKALNDPVKGISALTRVGVSFTEGQKSQIKAMVASGDTMGAQKLILKELNTEFGGAAKAAGESLPGQVERGKRAFEDMAQSIVGTFLPVLLPLAQQIPAVFQSIAPVLQGAATALFNTFGMLGNAIGAVTGYFQQNQGVLIAVAAVLGFLTVTTAAHTLVVAIQNGTLSAYIMKMGIVRGAIAVWTAVQWLLNAALSANPIALVVIVIAGLIAAVVWAYNNIGWFRDGVNNAWRVISGVTMGVLGAVGGFFRGLWSGLTSFGIGVVSGFVGFVSGSWSRILGFTIGILSGVAGFFRGLWGGLVSGVSGAVGSVMGFIGGLPGRILGALSGLGGLLIGAGASILGGLLQGMQGTWNDITNFVGGIGQWIADNKGPESYDRQLLRPHGGWILGGLRDSLADNLDMLQDPLDAVADTIAGSVAGTTAVVGRRVRSGAAGNGGGTTARITVVNPDPETAAELTARKLIRAGQK